MTGAPRLGRSPLANTKNEGPARLPPCVSHDRIGYPRVLRSRGAPVIFQKIHPPGCILSRVLKFVTPATWSLLTRKRSGIRIESELQSPGMNIIRQRLHSGRKSMRVRQDVSLRIAID